MALGKSSDSATGSKARRSTRVFQRVPLSVSGLNTVGNSFMELTSAVTVNCHGCLFPSRYQYQQGSWVKLLLPAGRTNGGAQPLRAEVKYVRLPRSPKELYQVGVELETPANIWGIKSPPEDWLRFPGTESFSVDAASAITGAPSAPNGGEIQVMAGANGIEQAERISPGNGYTATEPAGMPGTDKPTRVVVSPEQLLAALEGKLQQAAEKAVASAVSSRLGNAVNQAAKAIEEFSQASVRKVQDRCTEYSEKLAASAREEFLGRVRVELEQAEARLGKEVETLLSRVQEATRRLEASAQQVQPVMAQVESSLQGVARRTQNEFSTRLGETATRAAVEFKGETDWLSEQQIARLAEQAKATTEGAAKQLESRAGDTRAQLESAAGTALAELHVATKDEIERAVKECRQSVESSLTAFGEQTSGEWEARLRACQDELAHSSQKEVEQFREQLQAILNSSMMAAASAVHEHSKALLDSLAKETGQKVREAAEKRASS